MHIRKGRYDYAVLHRRLNSFSKQGRIVEDIKRKLNSICRVKDVGRSKRFPGLDLICLSDGSRLLQQFKLMNKYLEDTTMDLPKSVGRLLDQSIFVNIADSKHFDTK